MSLQEITTGGFHIVFVGHIFWVAPLLIYFIICDLKKSVQFIVAYPI